VTDLSKLKALDARERAWLALALAATPAVVLGLRIAGFNRMRAWMDRWPKGRRRTGNGDVADRARAVARVVGIAAGRGAVRTTCLRRSLMTSWLLRREGIPSTLRIGVRREGDEMLAHAWVEHEGVALESGEPALRYTTFDRDFGLTEDARP
jgi:hypothetical protein